MAFNCSEAFHDKLMISSAEMEIDMEGKTKMVKKEIILVNRI